MHLTNEFDVGLPVEEAWEVLTDIERIAPCLPGAQLTEVEGDEYRGTVKVKLGAITAQYKGAAHLAVLDPDARRAVLEASGRDTRGAGNASATITAVLVPAGDGTKVTLTTELKVTGKVAQFGRGVMADVSAKLLGQFVENLEATVLATPAEDVEAPVEDDDAVVVNDEAHDPIELAIEDGDIAATGSPMSVPAAARDHPELDTSPPAPTVRTLDHPEAEPVDLIEAAGGSVAKRVVPLVGAVVVVVVLWRLRRRCRRRRS